MGLKPLSTPKEEKAKIMRAGNIMAIQQDKPRIQKNVSIDKVLVIGPNGNIGRHLIPELLKLGYKVRALEYRSKVKEREGLKVFKGNTLDPESLEKAVDGVNAVCHLIRATGPGATPCERWFNCCIKGAVNLLEAAKEIKLVRFIVGSADNVFGHVTIQHYGSINENSPKRFADGYYGLFKILEEEMCRQYYLGFGVPIVITRFGWIWRTGEFMESGAGALDRKNKKIIKRLDIDGKPLVRHDTHIEDAVQGILLALQKDEAVGEDFNMVAPAPYSSSELSEILHQRYGWPIEETKSNLYSWTTDSSKARSVLGYRPQINVLDWLKDELNRRE